MKENQIRELVNDLRDIAVEYHGTQQLRERIARTVRAAIIQAGNSPAIPDGWVMVPVDLTPDMRDAYHNAQEEYESLGGLWSPDHQWKAMLAAAPQQEVK
ncbi:hypothetical protein PK12_003587 [Salmonella enterica subsp. enterica]|nr:hypothetical protein [Salmonella enterica]EBV0042325.1 hypothetical protein [Salmonella enterica subsp. enterica serovar Bonariensis]EBW7254836.1 hypothetical protein [Salmonella enterica subsp. enterica serovar Gatow]ECF3708634.1 hypothetical protein [Salmonella enterica subsp. enterica serovar Manhattan]EDX8941619.1 hypothetical protein [Salmonella enterica subsp. enterica serovar Aba]